MARNMEKRVRNLDQFQATSVLFGLIIYLEALERLYAKSDTLPESTKLTATLTLEEIDYLLGVYTENKFHFPRAD